MSIKTYVSVLVLFIFTAAAQASDPAVGYVKTVKGEAVIVRENKIIPAQMNEKVMKNDILKTGTNSSLGITLKDDTQIALGSKSELIISEFIFSPAEGKLNLIARMLKGCVEFASGIIAKLSPESVNFTTPVGDIALRGTRFAISIAEK